MNNLNELTELFREKFNLPSIVAAVSQCDSIAYYTHGFSDIEKGIPTSLDAKYYIASLSKGFTAAAICMLCESGKMSLDSPVKEYYQKLTLYDSYLTEHLTVRDVLSHRSGMPRHEVARLNQTDLEIRELVQCLRYLPPAFEPRTRMCYQNMMYTLASVLIEEVSGISYGEYIKRNLLQPLGMCDTMVRPSEYLLKTCEVSKPYILEEDKLAGLPFYNATNVGGASGMVSTIRDMAKWMQFHLQKGEYNGIRLISSQWCQEMHTPQIVMHAGDMLDVSFPEVWHQAYCLGWYTETYRGSRYIYHFGDSVGFCSYIGLLPDQNVAFTIMCNLHDTPALIALGYAYCDALLGLEHIDWASRYQLSLQISSEKRKQKDLNQLRSLKSEPIKKMKFEDYVGVFCNRGYGEIKVYTDDETLYCKIAGKQFEMIPMIEHVFAINSQYPHCGVVTMQFEKSTNSGKYDVLYAKLEPMCSQIPKFVLIDKSNG